MRGRTLLVCGCVLLAAGLAIMLVTWQKYQAESRERARSYEPQEIAPGVRNELGAWLDRENDREDNVRRNVRAAEHALPGLAGGGVIALVGLVLAIVGLALRAKGPAEAAAVPPPAGTA